MISQNNINNWSEEEIKRFWDYESHHIENYFTYQIGDRLVEHFEEFIENRDVLDYGAGAGFFSERLACTNTHSFACVENSPESVTLLQQKFSGNQSFLGAYFADELISKELKFDTIFLFEVIEHLTDDVLIEVIENINSLLREDGVLIISTPNNEDISKSFIYCPHCEKIFHRWQHVRSWSKSQLSTYLGEKGLVGTVFGTDLSIRISRKMKVKQRLRKRIKQILRIPEKEMDDSIMPNLVAIVRKR